MYTHLYVYVVLCDIATSVDAMQFNAQDFPTPSTHQRETRLLRTIYIYMYVCIYVYMYICICIYIIYT